MSFRRQSMILFLTGTMFCGAAVMAPEASVGPCCLDDGETDTISVEVDTVIADADIATYFKVMPSSLLPSLSLNNRLDMIDFCESDMKAEVTNLLGGKSEMTALTEDSACIRLSQALTVRMLLLTPKDASDNSDKVICLAQTYGTDSLGLSTVIDFYALDWKKLDAAPCLSELDEQRMKALNVQTILNRDVKILKNN